MLNETDLPKTRKEAIAQGISHYFTGKPCEHGHIAKRTASRGQCCACMLDIKRRYRKANPEIGRLHYQRWYAKNRFRYRRKFAPRLKARIPDDAPLPFVVPPPLPRPAPKPKPVPKPEPEVIDQRHERWAKSTKGLTAEDIAWYQGLQKTAEEARRKREMIGRC